jgi:hypothetical protein
MTFLKNRQSIQNYKPLKGFTDEELEQFLDKNEYLSADTLACVCSEILRRQLKKNDRNDQK